MFSVYLGRCSCGRASPPAFKDVMFTRSLRNRFTLSYRMVTFFIALLLSSFTISNPATRISIGLISALVFVLTVWCIWTGWESSDGGGATVWLDGFRPSIVRAYRRLVARVEGFVRGAFESLCNCLVFHSRDDNRVVTVHSSTVPRQVSQGGVGGV